SRRARDLKCGGNVVAAGSGRSACNVPFSHLDARAMIARTPPPKSGIAGVLLVFCIAALLAGIGFDLGAGARTRFWIGDQVGAAAAIGGAAAVFAVIAARVARLALGRSQESSDASADS